VNYAEGKQLRSIFAQANVYNLKKTFRALVDGYWRATTEVLAKHRRALLILGTFHFLRHFDLPPGGKHFDIEKQVREAGANSFLIVFGTKQ
jgi:hypothetical protein